MEVCACVLTYPNTARSVCMLLVCPLPGLDRQLVGLSLGENFQILLSSFTALLNQDSWSIYCLTHFFPHSRQGAWSTPGCFGQAYYGTDTHGTCPKLSVSSMLCSFGYGHTRNELEGPGMGRGSK